MIFQLLLLLPWHAHTTRYTNVCLLLKGPELFFILGDRTITYFCGWLGWMPMATLAAQICPPSVEATLFGLLMSCLNLGTSTSAYCTHSSHQPSVMQARNCVDTSVSCCDQGAHGCCSPWV
jgi:hypothetical protein